MIMIVWLSVFSLCRMWIMFWLFFVLSVLVGLFVRIIWLLFISVCVMFMCCCWLLDSWLGW